MNHFFLPFKGLFYYFFIYLQAIIVKQQYQEIMNKRVVTFLALVFTALTTSMLAQNQYTMDHLQGLSNSAVLCVYQDSVGLMWFGTYDGLNCYDGKRIEVYRADFSKNKTLDNNIISHIQPAENNHLWVQSFSGVNLFSCNDMSVTENYEFPNEEALVFSDSKGHCWVLGTQNLYYYHQDLKQFVRIHTIDYPLSNLSHSAFMDEKGALCVIPYKGTEMHRYALDCFSGDESLVKLSITSSQLHNKPITDTFYHHGILYFIDAKQNLFLYDVSRSAKMFIRNVSSLINQYGRFNNIISYHDELVVTLINGGILHLRSSEHYGEEMIRSDIRAFDVFHDAKQDILWLGTDGQGAVMLYTQQSNACNLLMHQVAPTVMGQVRGLLTDSLGNLWIGTKGDGLLKVPKYDKVERPNTEIYLPHRKTQANYYQRKADFNPVFTLWKKRFSNDFWVGRSDSTLSYYSYQTDRIEQAYGALSERLFELHGLYEENDSTLWIATIGCGIMRITISDYEHPRILSSQQIHCMSGEKAIMEFSSLLSEGDSVLWCGSRGYGLVRISIASQKVQVISLKERLKKAVDDILCLCAYNDKQLFVGTTAGLVAIEQKDNKLSYRYIGYDQGLFNDMIHGILKDDQGMLWLSTNKGIKEYDPQTGGSYAYYYSRGMKIGEFSDDSYYRCPYTGRLFMGGINGLIYMHNTKDSPDEYYPPILMRRLRINGQEQELNAFLNANTHTLRLSEDQNNFSLEYAALDYLHSDIEYSYMLEGINKEWSRFTKENYADFQDIPYGTYTFKVRYKKDALDSVCKELSYTIVIAPYWYHSSAAHALYLFLLIALFAAVIYYLWKKGWWSKIQDACQVLTLPDGLPEAKGAEQPRSDLAQFPYATTDEQQQFARTIMELIDHSLDHEEMGTTYLAEMMHMSPRQFYRKFKEISGTNPGDYIKNYKMEKAAYLLRNTTLTIQEVMDAIGIASRPYFYKEFARKYQTTPSHFRKNHEEQKEKV